MAQDKSSDENTKGQEAFSSPSISLPKGGGAIRGIGEKFAANPVTGTGSLIIPIATSPGRFDFGPQLSLSYDSGAGNGPFGFGWNLSLPSITRKTDRGLPKYLDADESDVFILSGTEDLVPILKNNGGTWHSETVPPRTVNGKTYDIQRYRPRIEGLFARIERWTDQTDPADTYWRSISKDNITTWYGKSDESRIFDPVEPSHIFSWLICESYDDKGNVIVYGYKKEDSANVDLSQVHEKNRTASSRWENPNRYLKRITYGNRIPYYPCLDENDSATLLPSEWLFEAVFDYGEHDPAAPTPNDPGTWSYRNDSFSSYRAGFEVRTYRLCHRVLMFHHFQDKNGVGTDCLVRSTDFTYSYEQNPVDPRNPFHSVLISTTQSGYKRENGGYLKKSVPPLEFEYSQANVHDEVHEVDPESLENLPYGLDGSTYRWVDLDGEGLSGILTEQAEGWFYKPNLSPINTRREKGQETVKACFGPVELVAEKPSLAAVSEGRQQFLDLAGDGQLDLTEFDSTTPGFYERTRDSHWHMFRPFTSLPVINWSNPNLRFVDLTGDGHADIIITEDDVFTWHLSLAEAGFDQAKRVQQAVDDEQGPRLIFADGSQSIYLADMCGDGLSDLVRIRNGEVCYWPNLGYGRFGAKVTMDNAPWFDNPGQFDQRRIRLADIDGTGNNDIIYLGRKNVSLYFNQSGNSWSEPQRLSRFPQVDNLSSVMTADLLGNGTACLVWSSPLPRDRQQPMRYINLMGGRKPHLLIKSVNNLGAETHIHYAPSTRFYLEDKVAGKPWITRLPFPVHVVERVETYDRISRNHFVTSYAYHHGYFDGIEREFRGFGMVEQWDTEEFATIEGNEDYLTSTNLADSSHMPPVHTKTWFHTGIYMGCSHVSNFFAGLLDLHDRGEYYREPAWRDDDNEATKRLLQDTIFPDGLTLDEEREACRTLKGSMLRQEVYTDDGTDMAEHPYTVTEQNFTVRLLQPRDEHRHAVFFAHPRETISYHYERNPEDPRTTHALTLDVDKFGNVLKSLAIGYGRRSGLSPLNGGDRQKQEQILITYTENDVTESITDPSEYPDDHRTPLACEARTYELTGFKPHENTLHFNFEFFTANNFEELRALSEIAYTEPPNLTLKQKRLIEHARTLYKANDLSGPLLLGKLQSLALPYESYKLALTPELITQIYRRTHDGEEENLFPPDPSDIFADEGGYVHSEGDSNWWIRSGKVYHSPDIPPDPAAELTYAREHFFLPHRFEDPFGNNTVIAYDTAPDGRKYNLLVTSIIDSSGNQIRAEHDYRVLLPRLIIDSNHNHCEVIFDMLGMVAGTAVKGKVDEEGLSESGDSLEGFVSDLTDELPAFMEAPRAEAAALLGNATTRIVYDLESYINSGQPACAATIVRERHVNDDDGEESPVQVSFSYSDGFGREIQQKIQAEPGPIDFNDPDSPHADPRWVGSGWTIFNNKGKPVRQYEPFFSGTHCFEFAKIVGVSPILFYDPLERVIATLHPNHTYEKVVFDPWRQETWDVNDTVLQADPKYDPDVADFFRRLTDEDYLPTWHELRVNTDLALLKWPNTDPVSGDPLPENVNIRKAEKSAANKTAAHANTPTIAYFDTLGRIFLTIADNGVAKDGTEQKYPTRVELDIEGNQRAVIDARENTVMQYDCDMLGNPIHQKSMDAGERWMLQNATGNLLRSWNSRRHLFRSLYDRLQRPTHHYLKYDDDTEILIERIIYGDDDELVSPENNNLRGQVYQHYDGAGVVTNESFDFKGNLPQSSQQLAKAYRPVDGYDHSVDWSPLSELSTIEEITNAAESMLEPSESYTTRSHYDALNRPISVTTPDDSELRPTYNEANLLDKVEVRLRGVETWSPFVTNINYDAKGQRTLIAYQNNVTTEYEYDPATFRLVHLKSIRTSDSRKLQNLFYTYDPSGNITELRDDAQQTIYHDGEKIRPVAKYEYDPLYRLTMAGGREHAGQHPNHQPDHNDFPTIHNDHPNDPQAMRNYTEQYLYDAVGNILNTIHQRGTPPGGQVAWKRCYQYATDSNRLLSTGRPNDPSNPNSPCATHYSSTPVYEAHYEYDPHGNMTSMPHLHMMQWDYKDQLQAGSKQVVNNGGTPEITYYVYDAAGQRVRKITENQAGPGSSPTKKNERIYLGGFEIYREYGNGGDEPDLERETFHIIDNQQRIALMETRTKGNDGTPGQLLRYQLNNHLGSSSLELDESANVISYEEYYPYGSTSYQAIDREIKAAAKRYRYTGKERDDETGLYYYGARYYAAWLGRWTSPDPAELVDGVNLYQYAHSNPMRFSDPSGCQDIDKSKMLFTWDYLEHLDPKQLEAQMNFRAMPKFEKGRRLTKKEIEEGRRYLEEMEQEANLKRQDLEMLSSNPLSSILYMWARAWSDDPRIHRGAIMAGEATFGTVAARTGFGQNPPTTKSSSRSVKTRPIRINLKPKPSEEKNLTPPPHRLIQNPLEGHLKKIGMKRIKIGGGNISGPIPSAERPSIPRPPGTSTEMEMLHPAGLRLGFREYLDLAIPGSQRINRSYMGMLEIYAAKTFKEGGGGEWQFQIWGFSGQTATHLILRWRPSTLQQGWSFEGVINVTQSPRMKAAEHRNFLKELLLK